VLSAIYLLAYVSIGVASLLLGVVATAYGLGFAVDLGAGVIALFSVISVALVAMTRHARGFRSLFARKRKSHARTELCRF
jgi:hypothetical protein